MSVHHDLKPRDIGQGQRAHPVCTRPWGQSLAPTIKKNQKTKNNSVLYLLTWKDGKIPMINSERAGHKTAFLKNKKPKTKPQ